MALIVTVSPCKLLVYLTRKVRHTHYSVKLQGKVSKLQKKKPALEEIIGSSSEEGIIKECLRESELVHEGQTKVRLGYFIINQSYECETSFSLYIIETTFLKLLVHHNEFFF